MEGWGRDRPGVVVPINACVIMDNMIIEHNHEQNLAYGFYRLMERGRVMVENELRVFLRLTIAFNIEMCMKIIKRISDSHLGVMEMEWTTKPIVVFLCHYVVCDELCMLV
jgi:hypothetical protein